jgi:hypothetical protein
MLKSFVEEERDGVARPGKTNSSKTTWNLGVHPWEYIPG